MEIREPRTEQELKEYYDLRWRILRKPWNQPKGSEKDDLEDKSYHVAAFDNDEIIGVGRTHMNSDTEAQVRFMATDEKYRGKGIGSKILAKLEEVVKSKGAKYVVLNARETALKFYEKKGYKVIKEGHTLFGSIPHFVMKKEL